MSHLRSDYPSQQLLLELFDYDPIKGLLIRKSGLGRKLKDNLTKKYRMRNINGKVYSHHNLVWIYFNGSIPAHLEVDHVNRDSRDDRLENLRLATASLNRGWNKRLRSDNTSGFRGVSYASDKKKWRADIANKSLGYFPTKEKAAAAYQQAAADLLGPLTGVFS